jgi:hypothetical protein
MAARLADGLAGGKHAALDVVFLGRVAVQIAQVRQCLGRVGTERTERLGGVLAHLGVGVAEQWDQRVDAGRRGHDAGQFTEGRGRQPPHPPGLCSPPRQV